jgi:signal transduction histidine kinase
VVEIDQIFREQLNSLHTISVEIASLRELPRIYDRALSYCLELTGSALGFIGLVSKSREYMDVAAVKGFTPSDPTFFDRYHVIPVRRSVFGVTIADERPHISNNVAADPYHVGTPPGHPEVRTFLGVPLRVGSTVIGMIGAANRPGGYGADDQRLLATFANQVAVAIDNARLYERQREMIAGLEDMQRRVGQAERERLLAQDRARIATGLHDSVGQSMFSLGLRINGLLESELDTEAAQRILEIRRMAASALDELRQVIFALAEPADGPGDLTGAVGSLLRGVGRDNELDVDLVARGIPDSRVESIYDELLIVVREALTNIVRHAHAHSVLISLNYEPERVGIVVQDDGVGLPISDPGEHIEGARHFGFSDMRHRIVGLGGVLEVEPGEECGLTVRVSVPLPAETT